MVTIEYVNAFTGKMDWVEVDETKAWEKLNQLRAAYNIECAYFIAGRRRKQRRGK